MSRRGLWEASAAPFDEAMTVSLRRWAMLLPEELALPAAGTVGDPRIPLRWGGMGLRSVSGLGPAARVAHWAAVLPTLPILAPWLGGVVCMAAELLAHQLNEEPPSALDA